MATKVVTAAFALCLVTGFLFVVPAAADPGTLYVSALGSDGGGSNCTSPDTPCATLTYALTQAGSGSTIDVAGAILDNVTVNTPVTITQWAGEAPAVVDGGAIDSVFTIASGVTAALDQLTIQDGSAIAAGGGIDVNTNATLTVTSGTVTGNHADTGGGIYNAGTLTVTGTTLSGNTATAASGVGGGGIDNDSGATTTLTDSTVSGNSAFSGAGLYNSGTTFVTDSTVSGNMGDIDGGDGGGIDNESNLNITDSTLSGNSSSAGGGLYNDSFAVLDDSTVSGNSVTAANSPPGSGSGMVNDAGVIALAGDIVATPGGAPAGGECFGGGFYDGRYNVDDDGSCGLHASSSVSDSASIDSHLGPLADNGGPTQTIALTAGTESSPNPAQAVIPASFVPPFGGGTASSCSQPDQRGVARSAPCDMGSFALSTPTAPAITSAASGTFTVGTAGSFEVTASGSPAPTFSETGVLPDGITLAGDGLLSGTPDTTTGGSYPITIDATNGVSPDASQAFTLTVDEAPTITSTASATFTVGTTGAFQLAATGSPIPIFLESGALPDGVTMTPAGLLSGTPATGSAGDYPVTIDATNGVNPDASQSFTLVVNEAPVITSADATTFIVGTAGSFRVTAAGVPDPTFFEVGPLPTGVTLTPDGVLSGMAAVGTVGDYPITIGATNDVSPDASQSFTLTVDEAPTITSTDATTFTVGTAGSFQVVANGSPSPTFTETGDLPDGVTLAGDGLLSGTPTVTTGGSYPITIDAINGVGSDATQSFTLTVDEPPAITSADATTFTVGSAESFQVTASGVPDPTFYEVGPLPTGVTLASDGLLSGTPATGTGGSYPIEVNATNDVAPVASQSFTLTVDAPPVITSADATTFTVGTTGSFQVTASGTPNATYSETGSLPTGVTLTAAGVLSGTPPATTGGSYPITIYAGNGVNPYTSQSFMLTVNEAPVITSADATTFTVGAEGSFQLTASGVPDPTFYEVGPLPTGVTLSADGLLSGTPATGSGGVYAIIVNATNDVSPDARQNFTLTVNEGPAITSADATTFTVGSMGSLQMTASGTPGPTFSETGPLPTGVTLTTQGLLSGTPAAGTVGIYTVTVNATNTVAPDANQTFTLTVNEAPTITSVASTTFTVGTTGSFQVTATGGPDPTFSETGVLPTGVTLTGDGLLSGRPAASTGGSYPITIHAGNGVDPDASQTFTLTVDQAPVITSADATSFTLGTVGSFQVTASGTPSPTYSETGDLPNGVTLTTAGLLSGTPAIGTGGDYTVTISGANGVAPGTTQTFTLTVTLNPVITSVDATTFTLGTAGSFRVTATGSPTFSETGALPSGVALASDGDLSGTPGAGTTGTYPLTITASSAVLPNGTQHFTLTVDQQPAITSVDGTTFTVGSAGSFQVTGTGTPGPTFSEAGTLPSGVSLTAAGLLSGTPATGSAGSYPLTITASNGLATGATQSFTLSVDNSAVIPPVAGPGYWELASDGGIFSFGSAKFYGSMGGTALNKPIVGMVATPNGQGYWMVASDGGIFSFGNAKFYGSMGESALNKPIVGMVATPNGRGYWLIASDGGIFSFGNAKFYGSMGGSALNMPIVGMVATPNGQGYWMVASDGGIFSFGNAAFHGSTGGITLNKPIVGMVATPNGHGYWMVASDGGIFSFGDATFYGSMGGKPLNQPMVALLPGAGGGGYAEVASDGGLFSFGDFTFFGSMGGQHLNEPMVGAASS